ncbi:MAG: hypothetical protein QXS69_02680 [Candidatus Aenigmatarchaeota archaeon]
MENYTQLITWLLNIVILLLQWGIRAEIKRIDEKFCDLTKRIYRLEDKVFKDDR